MRVLRLVVLAGLAATACNLVIDADVHDPDAIAANAGGDAGTPATSSSSGAPADGADGATSESFCASQAAAVFCADFDGTNQLDRLQPPALMSTTGSSPLAVRVGASPDGSGNAMRMALTAPVGSINFAAGSFHLDLGPAEDVHDALLRFRIYVETSNYSFMRLAGFRYNAEPRAYSLMISGNTDALGADLQFRGGHAADGPPAARFDRRWYQASVALSFKDAQLQDIVTVDGEVLRDGTSPIPPSAPISLSIGLYDSGETDRNELAVWFDDIVFTRHP